METLTRTAEAGDNSEMVCKLALLGYGTLNNGFMCRGAGARCDQRAIAAEDIESFASRSCQVFGLGDDVCKRIIDQIIFLDSREA